MNKHSPGSIGHNIHIGCRKRFKCCHHTTKRLIDKKEGEKVIILSNHAKKTINLGLHNGVVIHIIKNHKHDTNMVISHAESRYIISKKIAENIFVK